MDISRWLYMPNPIRQCMPNPIFNAKMHTAINTCRSPVGGSVSPTHNLAIFLLYNIHYEPHPCTIKTHLQSSIGHYKQINHLRQPHYDFSGCILIQRRSPQISEKIPHQRLEKTHTIHNHP